MKTPSAVQSNKLQKWVKSLSIKDLMIMEHTANKITLAVGCRQSSAVDIVNTVLHDPAMATKLLKVANSARYNLHGSEVSTVSQAVVLTGFETVKDLAQGMRQVSQASSPQAKSLIMRECSLSYQTAVQAKAIAELKGDKNPEEIFVAGLLYNVGSLAFLCNGGDKAVDMYKAFTQAGDDRAAVEKKLLGFTMNKLTSGLAKEWNLSENVIEAAENDLDKKDRWQGIRLCHALVEAKNNSETKDSSLRSITERITDYAGDDADRVLKVLHDVEDSMAQDIKIFGDTKAAIQIDKDELIEHSSVSVQISVLRKLLDQMQGPPDVSKILKLAAIGLHHGAGFDRVVVSILSSDRKLLNSKHILADVRDPGIHERFQINLADRQFEFVKDMLKEPHCYWIDLKENPEQVIKSMLKYFGTDSCLLAPLMVGARPIGMIYADCATTKRPIRYESYYSFQHFVQLASLCLEDTVIKRRTAV